MYNNALPVIVILGPTAIGKTRLAIQLSKIIKCEIINSDLFQMFKEINIANNQTNVEQFESKSHLFNFLNPEQAYSIKQFQEDARRIITTILENNKIPILVGGSVLYILSCLRDYKFSKQRIDSSKYNKFSNEELHKKLQKIDPKAASIIHYNNRRRVIRALEIFKNEKMSMSDFNSNQKEDYIFKNILFIKLIPDYIDQLKQNIEDRVDNQNLHGLKEEAKNIISSYPNSQLIQAIGIKEWTYDLPDKIILEQIKLRTKKYAKHQLTFLKKIKTDFTYEVNLNNPNLTFIKIEKELKKYLDIN